MRIILSLLGDPILHLLSNGRHQHCEGVGFELDAFRVSYVRLKEVYVVLPQSQEVLHAGNELVDAVVNAEEELASYVKCESVKLIEIHPVLVVLLEENFAQLIYLDVVFFLLTHQLHPREMVLA